MRGSIRSANSFRALKGRLVAKSVMVLVCFFALGLYSTNRVFSYRTGYPGLTNSPQDGGFGCSCHSFARSVQTTVTIAGPAGTTSYVAGKAYPFTVTVSNASDKGAGVDVATYGGTLTPGSGLGLDPSGLFHTSPRTFTSGKATWNFTYTPPSGVNTDTLYAVGNAVNLNGQADGGDHWNFAPKFVVQLGQNAVSAPRVTPSDVSISISPSPANSSAVLYLSQGASTRGHVSISNLAGQVQFENPVQEFHVGTSSVFLETSKLRSGVYFARVLNESNQTIAQTKLIVSR